MKEFKIKIVYEEKENDKNNSKLVIDAINKLASHLEDYPEQVRGFGTLDGKSKTIYETN